MKMRKMWGVVFACVVGLAASNVSAQEMSFRSGLITAISPNQVAVASQQQAAAPSRTSGAFGRALGRIAGRAASNVAGEYAYDAYQVASGVAQDAVAGAASTPAAGQAVTAYMVMLKFDDGSESAIQSAHTNGLQVGSRARVFGSGASAQIVAE